MRLHDVVVNRAERSDITWAFLFCYGSLVLVRSLYLGHPPSLPLHHLMNGGLLVFAFFMISDPKTTPDSRSGRLLFAFLVASGAALVHFGLYRPNGLLWSLACLAPTVPLIDLFLPGERYRWPTPQLRFNQGEKHEKTRSALVHPGAQPAR